MDEVKAFDLEAPHYDKLFSDTIVGKEQRRQVHRALEKDGLFTGQHLLELNCGTGIDALEFHRRGNTVLATDQSPGMLDMARKHFPDGEFAQLRLQDVRNIQGTFSLLFSNFGGVNCLSPEELNTFFSSASDLLKPGGHLVLVVMGKRCWWDNLYLLLTRKFTRIGRRNTTLPVPVPVAERVVSTWYYSPKDIRKMTEGCYSRVSLRPIGVFVPPSYLAPYFDRHRSLFGVLKSLDRLFRWRPLADFSDHYYLCLQKK